MLETEERRWHYAEIKAQAGTILAPFLTSLIWTYECIQSRYLRIVWLNSKRDAFILFCCLAFANSWMDGKEKFPIWNLSTLVFNDNWENDLTGSFTYFYRMFLGEFSSSNGGNVILINLPKVINENLMDVSCFLWKFFQRTLKHIEFSLYPT